MARGRFAQSLWPLGVSTRGATALSGSIVSGALVALALSGADRPLIDSSEKILGPATEKVSNLVTVRYAAEISRIERRFIFATLAVALALGLLGEVVAALQAGTKPESFRPRMAYPEPGMRRRFEMANARLEQASRFEWG